MIFEWKASRAIDVSRYLYTAKIIAQGIYGNKIYYVVPELPKERVVADKCVLFPRLKTRLTISDWDRLKNWPYIDDQYPDDLSCVEEIAEELSPEDRLMEATISELAEEWQNKLTAVETVLGKIIQIQPGIVDKIEICLTKYGSPGTYNLLDNKGKVRIYLRIGGDLSRIAELLIACLVRKTYIHQTTQVHKNYASNLDWVITESITDFLMLNTNLRLIFPNFRPTLTTTMIESTGKLARMSAEYLHEYGFSKKSSLMVAGDDVVEISGDKLRGLTAQENKVLVWLVDNRDKLCSYESIAESMWGGTYIDKFSLYAINKIVFQVRQKLKINNVLSARIETVRNKGYVLYC